MPSSRRRRVYWAGKQTAPLPLLLLRLVAHLGGWWWGLWFVPERTGERMALKLGKHWTQEEAVATGGGQELSAALQASQRGEKYEEGASRVDDSVVHFYSSAVKEEEESRMTVCNDKV